MAIVDDGEVRTHSFVPHLERLGLLGQCIEGCREQREKNGGMRARNGDFWRAMLRRTRPKTAPTQGERAKKYQPRRVGMCGIGGGTEPCAKPQ